VSLDLNSVMDQIGIRLLTLSGLRVFDYAADSIVVPAAIVSLPTITYDVTKARGVDKAVFPVHVLVSKISDRAGRDKLSAYATGTGSSSVKAAVDGTLGGTVQAARVTGSEMTMMTVAGQDYLAATFQIEVHD
jgi:hypothetical protein